MGFLFPVFNKVSCAKLFFELKSENISEIKQSKCLRKRKDPPWARLLPANTQLTSTKGCMESVSNTVLPVPSRKSRSSQSNRWEPKTSVLTLGSTSTSGLKESEMSPSDAEFALHVCVTKTRTPPTNCIPWLPTLMLLPSRDFKLKM